jgi:hypothetical protein
MAKSWVAAGGQTDTPSCHDAHCVISTLAREGIRLTPECGARGSEVKVRCRGGFGRSGRLFGGGRGFLWLGLGIALLLLSFGVLLPDVIQ